METMFTYPIVIAISAITMIYTIIGLKVAKWMVRTGFVGPTSIICLVGIPTWPLVLLMSGLAMVVDDMIKHAD